MAERYFGKGETVGWVDWMVLVVLEGAVMTAEESAFDSGKGITIIEIRKAAPLIAATANWATGLTGSMAVVSLLLKTTPSFRSCPRGRSGAAAAVPRSSTSVRLQTLTGFFFGGG
jgi:hypothetical protein